MIENYNCSSTLTTKHEILEQPVENRQVLVCLASIQALLKASWYAQPFPTHCNDVWVHSQNKIQTITSQHDQDCMICETPSFICCCKLAGSMEAVVLQRSQPTPSAKESEDMFCQSQKLPRPTSINWNLEFHLVHFFTLRPFAWFCARFADFCARFAPSTDPQKIQNMKKTALQRCQLIISKSTRSTSKHHI